MANINLNISELREDLAYDPETGIFLRRKARPGVKAGTVAGSISHLGYIKVNVLGSRYCAHRLAWFYYYETWPEQELDHIDGNPSNNSLKNLRLASRSENCQNTASKNSKLGASWHTQNKKYIAQIQIMGQHVNLGFFNTEQEAQSAYLKAKSELHTFQPVPRSLISPD